MFRRDAPYDRCTVVIADWFVERSVTEETRTAAALVVLHDGGGRPAPVLCDTLGQHLNRRPDPRPAWLGRGSQY